MSTTTLRLLPTIDPAELAQQSDDAEFELRYQSWPERERIALPQEQLKTICAIFFNYGCAHGVRVQMDEAICADIDAVYVEAISELVPPA